MARPSDVVIGIDARPWSVGAAAFDPGGNELGRAIQTLRPALAGSGMVELEPVGIWQTAVEVVHRLARMVPDLGRRTVALGATAAAGGLCLVDEDGEPVGPFVTAFGPGGGRPPGSAGEARDTAQLLDLLVWNGAPELDRAAHALDLQGWMLACLTGRPLRAPALVAARAGGGRMEREERERLTPPEADPREPLPLHPAGAAATGLWDGTPVVVAPPAPVAAGLAAGLADLGPEGGLALLEAETWLVRPALSAGSGAPAGWPDLPALDLCQGEIGGAALDWLVELALGLLADAGLIGLTRPDLRALLDRHAEGAAPARLRFQRAPSTGPGPWRLDGLGGAIGFADLARAVHEGAARSCRSGFEAMSGVPPEVRAAGALARTEPGRSVLPAVLGRPVRLLERSAPAATGAAFLALRTIGEIDGLAGDAWVEPFLGPPVCPDPALSQHYA